MIIQSRPPTSGHHRHGRRSPTHGGESVSNEPGRSRPISSGEWNGTSGPRTSQPAVKVRVAPGDATRLLQVTPADPLPPALPPIPAVDENLHVIHYSCERQSNSPTETPPVSAIII